MMRRERVPAGNQFTLWAFPPYATGTFPPSSTAFNSRQQLYDNIPTMVGGTRSRGTRSRCDIDILYNTTTGEHVPAMTWIYYIILLLSAEGTRSRREPVPGDNIVGYIYTTTREPVPGECWESVPGARCAPVPDGTRSRRAPVPAVPREPVPGEHVPAVLDSGGCRAGGAGGTVVRTHGYLSFSRRGWSAGALGCIPAACLGRKA